MAMLTLEQRKDINERLAKRLTQAGPIEGFRIVDEESHEVLIQWGTCTEEQQQAVQAALDTFQWDAPIRVTKITSLSFQKRLSNETRIAIQNAAKENPFVNLMMMDLQSAQEVDLEHPETIQGVTLLLSLQLITQAEADTLLAS